MKERIEWLDTAKGIGIILVVLGHIYIGRSIQNVYIYSFHIPLFFFVAGYLFEQKRYSGYGDFLFRMVKTRIVPYITFFVISYILFIARVSRNTGLGVGAVLSADNYQPMVVQPLLALLYANGAWLEKIGNVALWFLPCLFVTESLFFSITRTGKNSALGIWAAVLVLALMGLIESVYLKWTAPWSIDTALTAMVFYAGGHQARLVGERGTFGIPRSAPLTAAAGAAAFLVVAVFALLNGRVDLNTTLYGNYAYFLVAAFSGIYAVTVVSQLIPTNRLLSWLGRNSLVLFGLHVPLISFAMEFLNVIAALFTEQKIILQDDLYVILVACTTVLFTAAWVYVFNRFLSFLIGKGQKRGLKTLSY